MYSTEKNLIINPTYIETAGLEKRGFYQPYTHASAPLEKLSSKNFVISQEFRQQRHAAINKNYQMAKKMSLPAVIVDRQYTNPNFGAQEDKIIYQPRYSLDKINSMVNKKMSLPTFSLTRPENQAFNHYNDQHFYEHNAVDIPKEMSSRKTPLHKISVSGSKCIERIRTFARETTIHGMWHFIRNDRHWLTRLLWATAFCICFGVCSYFIMVSVLRYLSFEVKTTTSVDVAKEIEFPAITFCNENYGRKSKIGTNELLLRSLTAMIVGSREEYVEKLKEALFTCKIDENEQTNESSSIAEGMKMGYDFYRQMGLPRMFHMFTPDSYYSAVKCWWKNKAINCSSLFLNHMTDQGWCFTVNTHPDVIKSFSLGLRPFDTGYGVSKDPQLLKLLSTGPSNNLRIMLNVHQDDYCITKDDAAGFKILIHNSRVQPLFFLDRPISLSPGFETHIGIRFRRQIKMTASLGRCVDFRHLDMYPNATIYFKEGCYLECFSRNVYEYCRCVPAYGPPRCNYVLAEEKGVKYVNVCFSDTILCMKQYERMFLDTGLDDLCKMCNYPCNETEYDFQISYSYFPSVQSYAYYRNLSQTSTLEEMRNNYVVANFYVENMLINVITETQAFTIDQLVADMGGQLGFLLGMSVLSLFEFVQFIMPMKGK